MVIVVGDFFFSEIFFMDWFFALDMRVMTTNHQQQGYVVEWRHTNEKVIQNITIKR